MTMNDLNKTLPEKSAVKGMVFEGLNKDLVLEER